jgi:hypothetical protein
VRFSAEISKNNQDSLTIGQILGTAAENTGWQQASVSPAFPNLSLAAP